MISQACSTSLFNNYRNKSAILLTVIGKGQVLNLVRWGWGLVGSRRGIVVVVKTGGRVFGSVSPESRVAPVVVKVMLVLGEHFMMCSRWQGFFQSQILKCWSEDVYLVSRRIWDELIWWHWKGRYLNQQMTHQRTRGHKSWPIGKCARALNSLHRSTGKLGGD